MQGTVGTASTVDGFSYGLVTPAAAFLMACLGSALGLRCAAPSLRGSSARRPTAFALGTLALCCGMWTMHFVAMTGFSIAGAGFDYDRPTMFAGFGVGLLMAGAGLWVVGHRGATPMSLVTGGTLTGLGIASMHYLGMAGLRLDGYVTYDTLTVIASVALAVAAGIASLATTARHRGPFAGAAAAVCLGGAATGMHYLAMTGAHVYVSPAAASAAGSGGTDLAQLLPMLAGPVAFLVLAGLVMAFEPRLLSGGAPRAATAPAASRGRTGGRGTAPGPWAGAAGAPAGPHARTRRHQAPRDRAARALVPEPVRRGSCDLHDG
ncbi:MHYT domain-containing protein [Streptomyces sp. NPDC047002]|uniref:MHYT domain-containing protein n=1 Tax=Streptomyces sp. NPDC047002 TaxID=3155475 RepID=UPI00345364A4